MVQYNRLLPVFLLALLTACNQRPTHEAPESIKLQADFNRSDKSVTTNGNMRCAVDLLDSKTDNWSGVKKSSLEAISKSPYSSIGNIYKVAGKVFKVEQLPPTPGLNGPWCEVLMLATNPNTSIGKSTVDCIYAGSPDTIKSGYWASCTGYFIGTYDTQNVLGGQVESYVFVGYTKSEQS